MSEPYREGQSYRFADSPNRYNSGSQVRVIEQGTPQYSRINTIQIGNTQYVPKIIESGYIVGPPIAYTQQPYLPNNYNPYSPNKANPLILQASNHYQRDFSPTRSRVKTTSNFAINQPPVNFVTTENKIAPNHQIIVHPPPNNQPFRQQTVPKSQYDRCVSECKNWQTKYNQLHLKYMNVSSQSNKQQTYLLKQENNHLRSRIRQLENRQRNGGQNSKEIKQLIERYKQSTIKECYLLLDRYRLENKFGTSKIQKGDAERR